MRTAGAILTGGESRRMGRTQALVEVDGVAMAVRVADALRSAGCLDVVYVGGDPAELAALGVPVIADEQPGEGPIGGVMTALRHFSTCDLVVVAACDLPFLDAESVSSLVRAGVENIEADVVVGMTTRVEPMFAVWRTSALPAIEHHFERGVRALHRVIDELHVARHSIPASILRNVNRPGDLQDQ